VKRQDFRAVAEYGPGLIDALEELVFDRQELLPEAIYREVLPLYGSAFAALDAMDSIDVLERRRAAGRLAGLAAGRPLGRLAVFRLAQLAVAEPDALVWQGVLTAVSGDGSEPSIRLAYSAISHPSAEVRRRACEHLAAHPDAGHAKVLVPALEDESEAVASAAAAALGAAGQMDDTEPLRQLLRRDSEPLRLVTAMVLWRLRDPAGSAELERLAYSSDAKVRCQTARAMGETAEPGFVPVLIRLLDDRPAVCQAALEALSQAVGRDMSESDDRPPPSTTERVRRWTEWFEGREAVAAGWVSDGPAR
jgi:HEAT repeat protein